MVYSFTFKMKEKLLGIGEASSYQQQKIFHQTMHQSPPNQPKSTKSLSSHPSFWPDHSIPPSWIPAPKPPWRVWHWEMGMGEWPKPQENPTPALKGKKGMAEDGAVESNSQSKWGSSRHPKFCIFALTRQYSTSRGCFAFPATQCP